MKTRLLITVAVSTLFVISTGVVLWPEYGMVCNNAVVAHLQKHSNLFDENTTSETYGIQEIGLPFGVHPGNVKECVDYVLDKRESGIKSEDVFHGKSLSYWQNLDDDSLVQYYEDFGRSEGNFFEDLGEFLVKTHSEKTFDEFDIITNEMEIDWTGIRPSLPPRMGFDVKVNSTDGKSYRIIGTIIGNVISDNFQIQEDNGRRIGWTPAFDYSLVQINGTVALQICSMLDITCIENPVWDAVYRHDKDFTYFYYDTYGEEHNVQIGEHYIQIDKNQICHSFEDLSLQQISELECQEIRK